MLVIITLDKASRQDLIQHIAPLSTRFARHSVRNSVYLVMSS